MPKQNTAPRSFGQLALLDWVCEAGPGRRVFSRGDAGIRGDSTPHLWLYEIGAPGPDGKRPVNRIIPEEDPALVERLGGRVAFDTHALWAHGLFRYVTSLGLGPRDDGQGRDAYRRFVGGLESDPFFWKDSVFIPKREAFAFWESEGRDAIRRLREERAAERARVGRTVVIGSTERVEPRLSEEVRKLLPPDLRMPLPHRKLFRAYATAEVVRETDARLYVTDVRRLRTDSSWRDDPVEGRPPNQYVAKSSVMLDHAPPSAGAILREIDDDFSRSMDEATETALVAILPHLNAMNSRVRQGEAQRDEMIREALARFEARRDVRVEPAETDEADAAPGPRR